MLSLEWDGVDGDDSTVNVELMNWVWICEKNYVETADFVNSDLSFELFKVEVGLFKSLSLFSLFSLSVPFTVMTSLTALQAFFFNFLINFVFVLLFSLMN